jgi:hypothetical protein
LRLLPVNFFHTSLVLVVQIAVAPEIMVVLPVELQHFPLLLQLAVDRVTLITLQVVEEILLTVQEPLVLLALREVLQAHNRSHIQAAALLLVFLKVALVQLLTALFMEEAELVGLQIRAGLVLRVSVVLSIFHGREVKN